MEQVKEHVERSGVMRELAIQAKEVNFRWQGSGLKGRLVMVKVKRAKALELLLNKQVTPENIQEIEVIHLISNKRTLALRVIPEKSKYERTEKAQYEGPMFYIETRMKRDAYHNHFLSEKERRNEQKNGQWRTSMRDY